LEQQRVSVGLQDEAAVLLQALVRFNTVNLPGNERPAIEHLAAYVAGAGFETEILAADAERPNLVATLGDPTEGNTLVYLGHVDTVVADPAEWDHDPWSGDIADGFLWGRGALDMKSQVAAEAVAGAALARSGWRPGRGALKLVFVSDEETGGSVGARWLTEHHPDRVRCQMLINEGGGAYFEYGGARRYGVCCGERGVFRFTLMASGTAGHASTPRTGDNALVKLAPALSLLSGPQPGYDMTDASSAMLAALGEDPGDPVAAITRIAATAPELLVEVEPMLGVTVAPTMVHASDAINVIPSRARLTVDCRVPPGFGEDVARARILEVLGEDAGGLELEFIEMISGNASAVSTPLMDTISTWVQAADPGAGTVPVILPGFSDSRWFREAFPDCVAYGFFPQRYQSLLEGGPLVHSANERIDVRDLGFATGFYADLARELLG
jgi:acetylornithine deacetylase/succinyl-diaminopimelate desuccinylase-like protein